MVTKKEKDDYIRRKVAEEIESQGESIASIARKTKIALQAFITKLAIKFRVMHHTILNALRELGARI